MSGFARGFAALVLGIAIGTVLAFGLALGSVTIHRQVLMVDGNACPPTPDNPEGNCYHWHPVGGWPYAYLYDSPGISVEGSLSFEDTFEPRWFLADMAVFGALPAAGATLYGIRRRRPSWS